MYSANIEKEQDEIPKELVTKTEIVDVKMPMSKAMQLLSVYPALIVTGNRQYRGILDARSIYKAHGLITLNPNQSIEKYIDKLPTVQNNTKVDELVKEFYNSKTKALPFVSNGKFVGVLSRDTLLKMILSLKFLDGVAVKDAMTSPVIGVNEDIGVSQAKTVMENNRVNRLLVFRKGKPEGIITYFMLLKNYSTMKEGLPEKKSSKYPIGGMRIADFIEENPKIVQQNKDLAYAARLMVENQISSLVVVDAKNRPVGILTSTDLLESVMAKRRLAENRIFVSGFDDQTIEYEDEIRDQIRELVAKIEKGGEEVEYVVMHIKRIKSKIYDIRIRVSMSRRGIISAHMTDFLLDKTFNEALRTLKKDIMKAKEKRIDARTNVLKISE